MSMKFRVIIAVLLLAAVSTQQSVFAEVSDPTTETWAHPTRTATSAHPAIPGIRNGCRVGLPEALPRPWPAP